MDLLEEYVVPMHGCQDSGDAAFDRGAFGGSATRSLAIARESVAPAESPIEKNLLVSLPMDEAFWWVHSYTFILSTNWGFVLRSQTIVQTDND